MRGDLHYGWYGDADAGTHRFITLYCSGKMASQ